MQEHRSKNQLIYKIMLMDKFIFLAIIILLINGAIASTDVSFDANYDVTWGNQHVISSNQGRDIQLYMDQSSGAGFRSKLSYGTGFFHLRIKLPDKDSAGVVTAFYLTSPGGNHDELDFEFLGNKENKPITLQTNVFSNGQGNREQRFHLWFDPTADYHTYKILWNQHQIVFYVDDIPIRVFKNNEDIGVSYPSQPMHIVVSLWDGSDWATDGGRTKANWSDAPFVAHFQGFNIVGCPTTNSVIDQKCYSTGNWWNGNKFWKLNSREQLAYEDVRAKHMNYDYCTDKPRNPTPPPECLSNS